MAPTSGHGAPNGASSPADHPRCPPLSVSTNITFASGPTFRMTSRGTAECTAMGSSFACTTSRGTLTFPIRRLEELAS